MTSTLALAHLLFEPTDGAAPLLGRECESSWTIGPFGVTACIPKSHSCSQAPNFRHLQTASCARSCASSSLLRPTTARRRPTPKPKLSACGSWGSTLGVIWFWSSTHIDAGPTPLLPSTELTEPRASPCRRVGPGFPSFFVRAGPGPSRAHRSGSGGSTDAHQARRVPCGAPTAFRGPARAKSSAPQAGLRQRIVARRSRRPGWTDGFMGRTRRFPCTNLSSWETALAGPN